MTSDQPNHWHCSARLRTTSTRVVHGPPATWQAFHALRFFVNAIAALQPGSRMDGGMTITVVVFFASLVTLTLLQIYWAGFIISEAYALLA